MLINRNNAKVIAYYVKHIICENIPNFQCEFLDQTITLFNTRAQ